MLNVTIKQLGFSSRLRYIMALSSFHCLLSTQPKPALLMFCVTVPYVQSVRTAEATYFPCHLEATKRSQPKWMKMD